MSEAGPLQAGDFGVRGYDVLVTGGAGFIGSHLVSALATANDVIVYDDCSSGSRDVIPSPVTLLEGDVRDRTTLADVLADVDLVYHLAGAVSVERSVESPGHSHAVNVTGTMNLLRGARRHEVPVVAASSAAVYGQPRTVPIPETAPLRPTVPYGVDKLALDHYTRLFADLYDLPTTVLRFFNVYGPGQPETGYSGVISTFFEQARSGGPLTIHGDGTQTRDFVHVSDVVRACLLAATAELDGTAYNVGTGTETSISMLADTVRTVFEDDPGVCREPGRPGDVDRSRADLGRVRRELGFEPSMGLTAGLESLRDRPAASAD